MKVNINKDNVFKPVYINITCETQDELDRWSALFRSTALSDFLKTNVVCYDDIRMAGANTDKYWDKIKSILKY